MADLNITVKNIREKTDDGNGWKDCIEVDLKVVEDGREGEECIEGCMRRLEKSSKSQMTGEKLAHRWRIMKNCIDVLFKE